MHELSLAQGLVELVEEQAREHDFAHVRKVHLQLGALAHVEARALEQGFFAASRGTVAEGAVLEIDRPAGRAACMTCGADTDVRSRTDGCGVCGSHRWILIDGDQMRVIELEVD